MYVGNSLYFIQHGKAISVKYSDIVEPKETDNRTGDDIAVDVITRMGLKVVKQ